MPLLSVATSLVFSILVRFWLGLEQMVMGTIKSPIDNGPQRHPPKALFSSVLIRSGWGFGETLLLLRLLWLLQGLMQSLRFGVLENSSRTHNSDLPFYLCVHVCFCLHLRFCFPFSLHICNRFFFLFQASTYTPLRLFTGLAVCGGGGGGGFVIAFSLSTCSSCCLFFSS